MEDCRWNATVDAHALLAQLCVGTDEGQQIIFLLYI